MKNKPDAKSDKLPAGVLRWAWVCFAIVFALYFATASRTVPPYRDSGELITAAATLSIAHSPGYPVYMILGKAAVELGAVAGLSPAFSMNLLSSVCGAFAVFFLFLFIYTLTSSKEGSAFGALAAGVAYMNWYLAVVAEMYSLNLMFVAAVLYLASSKKYLAAAFIAGLTLGNHLTALFAMVPLVFYAFFRDRKILDFKKLFPAFLAGISVYLYHILRASSGPYINWGDPSTAARFIRVVSRAAYGHTLDLISRQVTAGQVFLPHLRRFFVHLFKDMTAPILACTLGGIFTGLKKKGLPGDYSVILIFIFILTGPFFLYMARMPLNPHASAIVEVGYMIPEAVLAVFAGIFLARVLKNTGKYKRLAVLAGASIFLLFAARENFEKADHSSNFFAQDYALNILQNVEKDAIVLMRRDHPMFSLWYMRDMENVREDVKVISMGLLSASWYRDKLHQDFPELSLPRVYESDTVYVKELISLNSEPVAVYMTDAAASELDGGFHGVYTLKPRGLLRRVYRRGREIDYSPREALELLREGFTYRGEFSTDAHYDFFTRDFIGLYASSYNRLGGEFLGMDELETARGLYRRAVEMDELLFRGWSNLAYTYFHRGKLPEAARHYEIAADKAREHMNLYTRREFFKPALAEILNSLGAVYEKKYRQERKEEYFDSALESYGRAISLQEDFSRAYFNRGVLYWTGGQWDKVVENLRMALRYDPGNAEIEKYLRQAERNLQ